jgi:predicted naringenin-chalcone synthase
MRMSFAVLGLGTAVPPEAIDQRTAGRLAEVLCCRTSEQATWLPAMYSNTGIAQRHMVLAGGLVDDVLNQTRGTQSVFLPSGAADDPGPTTAERMRTYVDHAGPLASEACRRAIEQAGVSPRELTHIVTVSCTGFQAPGVDAELIRVLELPATIERTNIGFMGCHGALNGLRVARAFAESNPEARVLLCATELCSLHYYDGWDPQKMIANALFADGAAALVGAGAAPSKNAWRMTASGSRMFPHSAEAMTWSIGDHGFQMTLSKKVPALIAEHLRPWLESWLHDNGLAMSDVASWAIHPGGPRILSAVEESLGLPCGSAWASYEIFQEYGNMSSPTVLFILERLRRADAARPCVALGFGPGLVAEAALFR